MNKEIEEMMLTVPQKIVAYDGNPAGQHLYGEQRQQIAEALYNAGYRKVLLDTENGYCVDCVQYAPWQLVERKIEELKSEIKQLEKENANLLKVCEEKFTFDTTENKKYSIFNSVRKEFAKKLKVKALLHCRTINCYECRFIETLIDELLEEYENDKRRD